MRKIGRGVRKVEKGARKKERRAGKREKGARKIENGARKPDHARIKGRILPVNGWNRREPSRTTIYPVQHKGNIWSTQLKN
ncbi:hypothetical protein D7Z54_09800 [Salibacterium salarium]|uniref:Uncharacterized protein n=1 Tax=Salibacterium salarium TaxID=284579 RepID=A0A3R9QLP0_9BACI|nr:hypothetical protein D7Z54_09800 [Salibacterium salarium]